MTSRNAAKAIAHFLATYVTAIPRIIYYSTLSLVIDPKGAQKFIHQVLSAVDLEYDDPVLGSRDIEELVSGSEGAIQIIGPYYSRRNSDTRLLTEIACLGYLMQCLQPKCIFEIGTFVGRTTRLLAENSPLSCQIMTLDLSPDTVVHHIGADYIKTSSAKRIHQLYGDSRVFDYSPWFGKCDFVWVDASHDYEYVLSDTRNALALCRSGGWIGWHDYRHSAWWSGVTRTVRDLRREYPNLCHLRGTTIAVLQKP